MIAKERIIGVFLRALSLCALATPAHAKCELRRTDGLAVMEQTVDGTTVTFQCLRASKDVLSMGLDQGGLDMPEVPVVMLWIKAPDGRAAGHSMDAFGEGPGLSATLYSSDVVLQQIRQAKSLEFADTGADKRVLRTNAKGRGKFRPAVSEQCGF
ncbi:MAG: hypothetical protein AAF415_18755 [Pseudomonadota bacterium]